MVAELFWVRKPLIVLPRGWNRGFMANTGLGPCDGHFSKSEPSLRHFEKHKLSRGVRNVPRDFYALRCVRTVALD